MGDSFPLKCKQRRTSANRDFPKDCGRFALRTIGGLRECDAIAIEESIIGVNSTAILELNPAIQASVVFSELEYPEFSKGSFHTKPSNLMKDVKSEAAKSFEYPDEVEAPESRTVEPLVPKALDKSKLLDMSKNLEPHASGLLGLQSLKEYQHQSFIAKDESKEISLQDYCQMIISAERSFPPACGRNAPHINWEKNT
uniref:Uncharacterized protein n=1 Tax=Nelumbo nucifera TaxID=4432 RepID=A0A822XYH5_NELNU|nr:TPA_asm: hypothetical protein HUJ06_026821 [Nelumbo nucifera]